MSQMFTCGLSDLLLLAVGSLVVLYCENVLNINYDGSEILVSYLVYIDQLLFLNKLLIFFLTKLTLKCHIY